MIVGAQATAARMSQETVAAREMLARFVQRQERQPASIAADATYGNGEFLQWLLDRGITPYMRTRDSVEESTIPATAQSDLPTCLRATPTVVQQESN